MKSVRTIGVLAAVGLAAIGLAALPDVDEIPQDMPGIVAGEDDTDTAAPGSAQAAEKESGEAGGAVTIPTPEATEQPVLGVHQESGIGPLVPSLPPSPTAAADPDPAPEQVAPSGERSSGGTESESRSSGSGTSSSTSTSERPTGPGGSSSSGSSSPKPRTPARPPAPSGLCEWDDDGWECDEADDDDDDEDDDDDGDDDDD